MNKLSRALTSYEEVRLGEEIIKIEHGPLENLLGCGSAIVVGLAISPLLFVGGVYHFGKEGVNKLSEVGKKGYNKVKEKYFKKSN